MSETLTDDSLVLLREAEGSTVVAAVDDEARLTAEDALAITEMLEDPSSAAEPETPESDRETLRYGETYWMADVGQIVKLGAAGVRREVQIDTGRQMAVRTLRQIGGRALGTGVRQLQISA